MTLCLTSPSGPAGAIVELTTPAGVVKSPVVNVTGGTAIAPGSYVGEPVRWNGVAYAPTTGPLVFDEIDSRAETDFQIDGDANLLLTARTDVSITATSGNATLTGTIATLRDATGQSTARVTDSEARLEGPAIAINALPGGNAIITADLAALLQAQAVNINEPSETAFISLDASAINVSAPQVQLTTAFADVIQMSPLGVSGIQLSSAAMGFFDKTPQARPTITGVTTQNQVDSLVAALVTLGLVVDGR